MNKRTAVMLTSLGIAIITGTLIRKAPGSETSRAPASLAAEKETSAALPAGGSQTQATPVTANKASGSTPVQVMRDQAGTAETATKAARFEYQKELDDFAFLKKKALLTEEEKSEKKSLLQNENFLRGLAPLLTRIAGAPDLDFELHQNMAVDLLFEALQSEKSEVAAQVLQSVIQDASIENAKGDLATRQVLAGIKGEILYHWSALEPTRAGEMQGWLPGPVSQKIWKNVVAAQQSNLGESNREATHQ